MNDNAEAGRYDEQRAKMREFPSAFAGMSSEFIERFGRIMTARDSHEALERAVDALWEGLEPQTISITKVNDDGTYTITHNYKDGKKWDHRIGEVVPDWGIAPATAKAGRAVFRVTADEEVKKPLWFLYPYFLSVPTRSALSGDLVTGTFAFGFSSNEHFNEESAVIASLVAQAYSTVCDSVARLDHGIEIGRVIEQERMVQRLHDTCVQEIFACECMVDLLILAHQDDAGLVSEFQKMNDYLHSANRNLRQVLADARTSRASGPVPLQGAVDNAKKIHDLKGGCPVVFVVDNDILIPSRVATIVEGVLGEALANVRKHSGAQNAIVSCSILGELLAVSVQDDGKGFSPAALEENASGQLHFGISNLRSMVERVGGSFAVVSSPEEGGTTVRARIPLTGEPLVTDVTM